MLDIGKLIQTPLIFFGLLSPIIFDEKGGINDQSNPNQIIGVTPLPRLPSILPLTVAPNSNPILLPAPLPRLLSSTPLFDGSSNSFDNPRLRPPIIPISVLFANDDYSQVEVSPDGQWISYIAPYRGAKNVWVIARRDLMQFGSDRISGNGRPVSKSASDVDFYQWLFTDKPSLIYYKDSGGDENYGITKVEIETGREQMIVQGGNGVRSQLEKRSVRMKDKFVVKINNRDPSIYDYFIFDAKSAEKRLLLRNEHKFGDVWFDSNLMPRLAQKLAADVNQDILRNGFEFGEADDYVYFQLRAGGDANNFEDWEVVRRVNSVDNSDGPQEINLSGTKIYWVNSEDGDKSSLVEYDLPLAPNSRAKVIVRGNMSDIYTLVMDRRTDRPAFVSTLFDRQQWFALSPQSENALRIMQKTTQGDQILNMNMDLQGRIIIIQIADVHIPVKYMIVDMNTGTVTPLVSAKRTLESFWLPRAYAKIIRTRDGFDQLCYVTVPSEVDNNGIVVRPVPLVMLVHGGPWSRDIRRSDEEVLLLANRGYAVMQCQFRGSQGLGKNWQKLGYGQWSQRMHDDIIDGVNWALDNNITRRDQVAIMGTSYGGYEALVGLTFTPDVFSCGVDNSGVVNPETLLNTIPPYWQSMLAGLIKMIGFDHRTSQGRQKLMEQSPLYKVDQIRKPLLIIQGKNDPRVKETETNKILTSMNNLRIPVTYLLFPDEGHGIARAENVIATAYVVDNFLQGCLGGRAEKMSRPQGTSMIIERVGNMKQLEQFEG